MTPDCLYLVYEDDDFLILLDKPIENHCKYAQTASDLTVPMYIVVDEDLKSDGLSPFLHKFYVEEDICGDYFLLR